MIVQRFLIKGVYPEHVWTCRSCEAELESFEGSDGVVMRHQDGCPEVGTSGSRGPAPDQALQEMWDTCDSDDLTIGTHVDQWWVLSARCQHGKFRGTSHGPADISHAFSTVLEKFRAAHVVE